MSAARMRLLVALACGLVLAVACAPARVTQVPRDTAVPVQTPAGSPGSPAGSFAPSPGPSAAPTAAPPEAPTPEAVTRCASADLSVHVAIPPGHAAGSAYYVILLTNVGADPCAITGYPTISFATGPGGRETPTAGPNGVAPEPVVVDPGATAHAVLQIPDSDLFDPASCRPATGSVMRVVLPGDRIPVEIRMTPEGAVCFGSGSLVVSPVSPGVGAF